MKRVSLIAFAIGFLSLLSCKKSDEMDPVQDVQVTGNNGVYTIFKVHDRRFGKDTVMYNPDIPTQPFCFQQEVKGDTLIDCTGDKFNLSVQESTGFNVSFLGDTLFFGRSTNPAPADDYDMWYLRL